MGSRAILRRVDAPASRYGGTRHTRCNTALRRMWRQGCGGGTRAPHAATHPSRQGDFMPDRSKTSPVGRRSPRAQSRRRRAGEDGTGRTCYKPRNASNLKPVMRVAMNSPESRNRSTAPCNLMARFAVPAGEVQALLAKMAPENRPDETPPSVYAPDEATIVVAGQTVTLSGQPMRARRGVGWFTSISSGEAVHGGGDNHAGPRRPRYGSGIAGKFAPRSAVRRTSLGATLTPSAGRERAFGFAEQPSRISRCWSALDDPF